MTYMLVPLQLWAGNSTAKLGLRNSHLQLLVRFDGGGIRSEAESHREATAITAVMRKWALIKCSGCEKRKKESNWPRDLIYLWSMAPVGPASGGKIFLLAAHSSFRIRSSHGSSWCSIGFEARQVSDWDEMLMLIYSLIVFFPQTFCFTYTRRMGGWISKLAFQLGHGKI